ncbi:hypothetical protein CEXT_797231 [Caerostris extrusa]|uniref:Uncharacterized protein n=1 Tax=Caerostris extrusa TaxID=172846 RepID=A0AAV4RD30_CAEEX|nr:hypothetical protein CEXT_797231 [Caerostris extrusa]
MRTKSAFVTARSFSNKNQQHINENSVKSNQHLFVPQSKIQSIPSPLPQEVFPLEKGTKYLSAISSNTQNQNCHSEYRRILSA